ncbi:MAG: carboxypeptidase M32, partial [Chitinophagales bacterium]
ALYEQGLSSGDYGLPTSETISLGIHESQSRLWENNVGRGLPFWKANYSALQQTFPENLENVSLQDFYKSMNLVKPSLIRTNADELTYHFHILVRFEIEKALIEGSIEVKNLDEVWVEKYKEYLGIEVPSDCEGILQDIHWSHGSLGYFPTYSLGSFYAAQFYAQANKDVP